MKNFNESIKSTITSAVISTAIAGMVALADKAVKEYDAAKLRSRNGYKNVCMSSIMCGGIKAGQFCVADGELLVGFLPEDMKTNVSASSFQIAASVPFASDENPGWYHVHIDSKTRTAFFDGSNILIVPTAKEYAFITRKLDVGTDLIRGDIEDLTDKVKSLEKVAKELNERLKAEKAAAHKAAMKAKKPEKEYDETKGVDDEDLV